MRYGGRVSRLVRTLRFALVVLAALAGCEDGEKPTSGAASPGARATTPAMRLASSSPPAASASTTAAPTTIFMPLPGTTASAAIDARWPAEGFAERKSKLAGFEVFASGDVSVALKRHHVDNVTNENTARFPACPSIASVQEREGVEVMARGGGDAEPMAGGNTPSWMVYRERQRFGVIVVHAAAPRGDYGTDVACCLSGSEVEASATRATLTNAAAKKALEACLAALSRPSGG